MNLTILVGPPGSGKSTLAKRHEKEGFTRISQDDMGKLDHLMHYQNALCEKKDIVVDRMNFSKEQRARYITTAKARGYEVSIVVLHVAYDECLKRCLERQGHPTITEEKHARSALHTFFTKYERPTEDEGKCIFMNNLEYEVLHLGVSSVRRGLPDAIWIDIDNTLSNAEHRQHFMSSAKKNWKGFFEAMGEDSVNEWCRHLIDGMKHRCKIILCSARPDDYRKITESWLLHNNIYYDKLVMRHRNDFRPDYIVKEVMLDFEICSKYNLLFSVDDRKQVIDKIRDRGVTVLDCAGEKGNF